MSKDLLKEEFREDTSNIIGNTLLKLAEGVTGIAASKREEWALSIGHIFQGIRGGQFLSMFMKEWEAYRKKGKIKDDYQASEQNYICLHELLKFLEDEIPDQIRFDVMKRIFLVAATESASTRDSILPQQYMKICKTLSSAEILILQATHAIAKEEWWKGEQHFGAHRWLELITDRSGLAYIELVEVNELELINKRLLSERLHSDRSGVRTNPYFRLTGLGFQICEFIQAYEALA